MLKSCEKFVGPSKTAMASRRPAEAKDFSLMKRAVSNVITWSGLNDLHQYQEDALIGILDSGDVFVAHPTGIGESVVYQLAPFASDIYDALVGSQDSFAKEKVLVIQPLISPAPSLHSGSADRFLTALDRRDRI